MTMNWTADEGAEQKCERQQTLKKNSNKQNKTKQKAMPLNIMENSPTNAQALALFVRPASSSELA